MVSAAVAYTAVVYGGKALPHAQLLVFALHIGAYLAYIIPIWMNAPKASHQQVWNEFRNTGGWSSLGLAVLVGQLTGISEQVGIDTVSLVHAPFVPRA